MSQISIIILTILLLPRKVTVRGLCEASMFDRMYFYNIGENGQVMYFGELSSIVIHDPVVLILQFF